MKIFTGGSISLKRLPSLVDLRVMELARERAEFLVGDAFGADLTFQSKLLSLDTLSVTVFFSGPQPRNNLGKWPARRENPMGAKSGHRMHGQKDLAMAQLADHGLMLWDGESVGTLVNCINLLRSGKSCEVWFEEEEVLHAFLTEASLMELVDKDSRSEKALREANKRLGKGSGSQSEEPLF